MIYYALFDPDREAGGFVVTFPDFGKGVTQGDSLAEATEMATDLLACLVSDLMKRDTDLPRARNYRGRHYRPVPLPALQAMKAQLYTVFRSSGIRKTELARRLNIPKSIIDRLFDLNHHSRLDQIEAAFRALGKELAIEVRDAA
jgi:antitoxin HicB